MKTLKKLGHGFLIIVKRLYLCFHKPVILIIGTLLFGELLLYVQSITKSIPINVIIFFFMLVALIMLLFGFRNLIVGLLRFINITKGNDDIKISNDLI